MPSQGKEERLDLDLGLLNDPDPAVREETVRAMLSNWKPEYRPRLERLLDRRSWQERKAALEAMDALDDLEAIELVLHHPPAEDFTLRRLAVEQLFEWLEARTPADEGARRDLVAGMAGERHTEATRELAAAVSAPASWTCSAVPAFLEDPSPRVRAAALGSLSEVLRRGSGPVDQAYALLADREFGVRAMAARALAAAGWGALSVSEGSYASDRLSQWVQQEPDRRLRALLSAWFDYEGRLSGGAEASSASSLLRRRRHWEVLNSFWAGFRKEEDDLDVTQVLVEGLNWLVSAQESDGRWDVDRWNPHTGATQFPGFGVHDRHLDPGATGLCVLAFLGAGYTHEEGPFREVIGQALDYLVRVQGPDGEVNFHPEHRHGPDCLALGDDHGPIVRRFNHNLATLALTEAYAQTGDRRYLSPAQMALNHALETPQVRFPWSYYLDAEDIASSIFLVMAMRIGRDTRHVDLPEGSWGSAQRYLARLTDRNSGRIRYPGAKRACFEGRGSAAAGAVAREVLETPIREALREKSAAFLLEHLPVWNPYFEIDLDRRIRGEGDEEICDQFYWHFGTLALILTEQEAPDWFRSVGAALCETQRREGGERGSWDPDGVWGRVGGRVYGTAMAILTLEAPAAYAP